MSEFQGCFPDAPRTFAPPTFAPRQMFPETFAPRDVCSPDVCSPDICSQDVCSPHSGNFFFYILVHTYCILAVLFGHSFAIEFLFRGCKLLIHGFLLAKRYYRIHIFSGLYLNKKFTLFLSNIILKFLRGSCPNYFSKFFKIFLKFFMIS